MATLFHFILIFYIEIVYINYMHNHNNYIAPPPYIEYKPSKTPRY